MENLSYFLCPDNQKKYKVFGGESHIDVVAEHHALEVLAKLPIDPLLSEACDNGTIEAYQEADLSGLCDILESREK